jgi:hypothetical protein
MQRACVSHPDPLRVRRLVGNFRARCARAEFELLEPRRLLAYDATSYGYTSIDLVPGVDGAAVALDNSDNGFVAIDLGNSAFRFFGTTYTGPNQLFVSVNGVITFGSGSTSISDNSSPLTTTPSQPTIAPLWDNWDTSDGADSMVLYRFQLLDGDEVLVIEWQNVPHVFVGAPDGVTFQAILELNSTSDDSEIIFNYVDLGVGSPTLDNAKSATVGIKAAGEQGGDRLLISHNAQHPLVANNQAIKIEPPDEPEIESMSFHWQTAPQRVDVRFNVNVSASVEPVDLDVQLQSGGPIFHPDSVDYDPITNTAKFNFASKLPDGRYIATLPAGRVTNLNGEPLEDGDSVSFFFLDGDANHDAIVNLQDFNILAINFGQSERDYAQADFNYDGLVNLQDFNILATKFGQSIGPTARLIGEIGAATETDPRDVLA